MTEYQKYVYVPISVNKSDAATLQQIPGLDADAAAALIAARPYASNDAFLAKLTSYVSPAEAAAAAGLSEQPMNAETILSRLRRFLLALAAFLLVGTLVELIAVQHTQEPMQLVPFALCIVGLVAIATALARPQRKTLLALRMLMIPLALGSLLGVWEHVENNVAFYLEVHGAGTTAQLVAEALGGRNPLLAPGMLALAAVLAAAATYYHPVLTDR